MTQYQPEIHIPEHTTSHKCGYQETHYQPEVYQKVVYKLHQYGADIPPKGFLIKPINKVFFYWFIFLNGEIIKKNCFILDIVQKGAPNKYWSHLELFGIFWSYLELFETIWSYFELFRAISSYFLGIWSY